MDPNATLSDIRELTKHIMEREDSSTDASDLAVYIQALDQWLSNGGFLPKAWNKQGK